MHNIRSLSGSPHAVRAHLQAILASDLFARCRRMQRFLAFIVEETLAGRADQLGEYAIGTAVFDRGAGFDPAIDPIVRNDARRLRLKLLEYYRQPGADAGGLTIEVPKGGYVPVFRDASQLTGAPPAGAAKRVAVLPFESVAEREPGPAEGRVLCHLLTAHLTGIDGLEVVAHNFLSGLAPAGAATALRLSHAVVGCILPAPGGDRVMLTLVRVADGTQLWARAFDLAGADRYADESAIAQAVAQAIMARLTAAGPRLVCLPKAA